MSLKLICGPTGSGKTTRAIEAFLAALDDGKQAAFIAPSHPDARHFQRQILRRAGILTSGRVITFEGLCQEILERRNLVLKVLDDTERYMLLKVVVDGADGLTVLKDATTYDGFARSLGRLIAELEGLGFEPKQMGRAVGSWAEGNSWREGLNRDLFRLYQEYRGALEDRGVHDAETAQQNALRQLVGDGSLLGYDVVVVDGFGDFTPLQHELIKVISALDVDLLVTLPRQEGRLALALTEKHWRALEPMASVEYLETHSGDDRHETVRHIAEQLFDEMAPTMTAGDHLHVLTAAGERGQAEMVAAEIFRLARAGQSLDGIAVITRDSGADAAALSAVFKEYGLPFEMAAPIPLGKTLIGRAAFSLLRLTEGGSAEDLLEYLRNPLAGASVELVDRLDREAKRQSLDDTGSLEKMWRQLKGRPLKELKRLREVAGEGLAALARTLAEVVQSRLSETAPHSSDPVDSIGIEVLSLGRLISICHEAEHSEQAIANLRGGSASATADTPIRFLRSSILAASVRPSSGRKRGCVRLLDPHRALNQRFDVVFVCGLIEGRFPVLGREDIFFSDGDRHLLGGKGLVLDTREGRIDEERFLFHRALTRARERVYLCYPYCDQEGRPSIRSLFVDDVLDLFEDGSWEEMAKDIGQPAFETDAAPTASQALRSLALLYGQKGSEGLAVLKKAAAPAGLAQRLDDCVGAAALAEPRLRDDDLIGELAGRDRFRVTELERYIRCPYLYFLEKIVRPADFELAAVHMTTGSIYHRVIERLTSQLLRAGISSFSAADEEQAAALRQYMLDELEASLKGVYLGSQLETEMIRVEIERNLDRFIEREGACQRPLVVEGVEVEFGASEPGRHSRKEMLRLGEASLSGRIDRLDREEGTDRAVVIDYKSSAKDLPQASFAINGLIQIPLYMKAVQEIWGLRPVAGEYYSLKGSKRRGLYSAACHDSLATAETVDNDFVDEETFSQRLEEAEQMALRAIRGIREARFPRQPLNDGKDICNKCDYAGICRRDSGVEKEWADG